MIVRIRNGAPGLESDIRLGDVVISEPEDCYGGVIQYDFGKLEAEGKFWHIDHLNRVPDLLLNAVMRLKAKHEQEDHEVSDHRLFIFTKYPKLQSRYSHPDPDNPIDNLFKPAYENSNPGQTCTNCDNCQLIDRAPRTDKEPVIHYSLIASANKVTRHRRTREQLSHEKNVKCFEVEAAGLMDLPLPCDSRNFQVCKFT